MTWTSPSQPTATSSGTRTIPSISGASLYERALPGASDENLAGRADELAPPPAGYGLLQLGAFPQALEGERSRNLAFKTLGERPRLAKR